MADFAFDDLDNQRQNSVEHLVNSDIERGLPKVGKHVYDLRDSTLYICTDVTPDPTLFGGGTWVPVGSGGAWQYFTPVLHSTGSGTSIGTDGAADGQYAVVGQVCHVQLFLQFGTAGNGAAAGTGSYWVDLVGLPHRNGPNFSQGNGSLTDVSASDQQDVVVIRYPAGLSDPRIQFTYTGSPVNLVGAAVPWAWADGDLIEAWFTYRTV